MTLKTTNSEDEGTTKTDNDDVTTITDNDDVAKITDYGDVTIVFRNYDNESDATLLPTTLL